MAKQTFRHGDYRLSWLHDEACAVKGHGRGARQRFRLGVFRSAGEEAARSALVSFVITQERGNALADGTVGAFWKAYYEDREKDGKVMSAFDSAWVNLKPFFAHLRPHEINRDVCREYARMRFETGIPRKGKSRISNDTVWTELTKLASCFGWCVKARLLDHVPPMWFPKRSRKRDEVLSPADVQKLLDACFFETTTETRGTQRFEMWHLYFFVVLMMCTGGRPTAVLELIGGRCMFGPRLIDLRIEEDDDPMSKRFMKGRAMVHMNDLALNTLLQARAMIEANGGDWETSTVIQWRGGSVDRISKGFRALVARAGLPDWVSPHKLRHAVATWVDAEDLHPGNLLGHKKGSKATEIYIHGKGERTKAATEVVDKKLNTKRLRAV